ncbi:MAG: DNA polymerase III subunit epsilon [Bauldia sp.]|nr:DNA polymerase III subunit epsilon [Bauldia sp.]
MTPAPTREIAFDTETTGLDLAADRIIELGCVELINHVPTGRTFQAYINPERAMSIEAYRVHGLSDDFLRNQPVFAQVVDEFLAFVDGAPLVAHNAEFDLAFVNAELARLGRVSWDSTRVVDSLAIARQRHPTAPNSLDALCSRYGVDTSKRIVHGALLDAQLLAEIYVELLGGRQASLLFDSVGDLAAAAGSSEIRIALRRPEPRPLRISAEELAAHAAFTAALEGGGLWRAYRPAEIAA